MRSCLSRSYRRICATAVSNGIYVNTLIFIENFTSCSRVFYNEVKVYYWLPKSAAN